MTEKPDIQITDKHYAPVGRVANAWATFEFYIDELIWRLLSIPEPLGACVTAQLIGPGPRFRALAALVLLRGGSQELFRAVNQFSEVARGVASDRNRWEHDPMFIDEDTQKVSRLQVTADKRLVYELVEADPKAILALESKIWGTVNSFKALADRIVRELPASFEIPVPPWLKAESDPPQP